MDSMMNYNTVKAYFESTLVLNPTNKCEMTYSHEQIQIHEISEDESDIGFLGRSLTREDACSSADRSSGDSSSTRHPIQQLLV